MLFARWVGGWGSGERIKKYNWFLQSSHDDVKYSIGNTVNDILITRRGAGWVLDLLGWSQMKLWDVWSLRCTRKKTEVYSP